MKKSLALLLLLSFLTACKEQVRQDSADTDSIGLSQQVQIETARQVSLTPEATQEVSQWLAYATAQNEIRDLKSATGHQIITSSQPLVQIMETLETTLPDTLKVVPVEARANVLNTKARVLHQLSTKKDKNAEEIFRAANELVEEFENFKLQLNERFLRSPEDFEMELDREFQEAQPLFEQE